MVDLRNFNLSGTLGALSLIFRPAQCLPQAAVRNFNELPIPISKVFESDARFKNVNIRAVVLDKDDCFARPGETEIAAENKVRITFVPSRNKSDLIISCYQESVLRYRKQMIDLFLGPILWRYMMLTRRNNAFSSLKRVVQMVIPIL